MLVGEAVEEDAEDRQNLKIIFILLIVTGVGGAGVVGGVPWCTALGVALLEALGVAKGVVWWKEAQWR